MKILKVRSIEKVVVGDYPFAEQLRNELVPLLENFDMTKDVGHTNVKAVHTGWQWEKDNWHVKKLKRFIGNEIRNNYPPMYDLSDIGERDILCGDMWANIYNKGDYADSHNHRPAYYSFVYFLKTKWYDSSLVFSDSGQKVRPKEGRYVIFSAQTFHHVPKHKFDDTRITLAGNYIVSEKPYSGGLG